MQALMSLVVFSLFSGFISCHEENNNYNSTYFDEELWDLEYDVTDDGIKDEITTELEEFDSDGCDRKLLKHFKDRCEEVYEKINDEALMMEDKEQRKEAICCALEDFEKCNLRACDQANCVTDKADIRENVKAAHLFLRVIEHISCNELRDQCPYYNSAVVNYAGHAIVLFSVLVKLTMYWRF